MHEQTGATDAAEGNTRRAARVTRPLMTDGSRTVVDNLIAERECLRRQHAASARIFASLGETEDLETILQEIAAAIAEAAQADSTAIFLYDEAGSATTHAVLHNYPPHWPREQNLLLPPSSIPAEREAIATGQPVVSNRPADYLDPSWPRHDDGPELQSFITAPLLRHGRALGCLHVNRYTAARPFTEDDAIFAREVATQAVLAIDRAQLFASEQRRRVEAEAVATVANAASSLALPEVLDAALRMAARAIPCDLSAITLVEPAVRALRIVAAQGPHGDDYLDKLLPLTTGFNATAYRERRPLLVADAKGDSRRFDLDDFTRTLNNVVCAPLIAHDRALGTLYLARNATASFCAADLRLLETLAGPVALAVERAQLYAAEQARATRAEALREIGRELSAELDFARFLTVARQQVARIIAHDNFWLALWDEAADELDFCLYIAQGERLPEEEICLTRGAGLAWALIDERAPIRVPDYVTECRRRGIRPAGKGVGRTNHAWLGAPLLAGGRIIGAMSVQRSNQPFTDEELATLEILAGQIAAPLENARLYHEARQLARTDPLTGVANHRHVQERLDEELARAARHGHPLAAIMADLDNFKLFNDTYGHPAGDQILRLVAEALRAEARAADLIGRYGGDEFLIVLPETTAEGALAYVERVRARLARTHPALVEGREIPLTLSTGIAAYPQDATRRPDLVALADSALYASKRGGGRTVVSAGGLAGVGDLLTVATHTSFGVVEGLVLAVDAKDNYTVPHSMVVADIALLLADALGLPEQSKSILRTAGLLHDVGKISIPDRILRKPGPLTDEEWQVMCQHVEFSELIIRGVPGLSDILEPVRHHHERWDGRGYPRGLAGEAVPLLGRIMIVADAYSAMTLDRPYRRGLTVEEAIEQLRAGAGIQFDPHLVAVLCDRLERETLQVLRAAS